MATLLKRGSWGPKTKATALSEWGSPDPGRAVAEGDDDRGGDGEEEEDEEDEDGSSVAEVR